MAWFDLNGERRLVVCLWVLKSGAGRADTEGMSYRTDPNALDRERSVPCQSGAHGRRTNVRTFRRNALCDPCAERAHEAAVDALAAVVVAVVEEVVSPSASPGR